MPPATARKKGLSFASTVSVNVELSDQSNACAPEEMTLRHSETAMVDFFTANGL